MFLLWFSISGATNNKYDNQVLTFIVELGQPGDSTGNKIFWSPDLEHGIYNDISTDMSLCLDVRPVTP